MQGHCSWNVPALVFSWSSFSLTAEETCLLIQLISISNSVFLICMYYILICFQNIEHFVKPSALGPIPESCSWDARNCSNLRLTLLWWWRMKKQDTGTEMLRLGKLCSLIGTYHPFSKSTHGAGEMAQCLRAPTALLKVLSSNPCNHMLTYNHL